MATTLTLSDARTELIHLAAIEGKTGSDSRHPPARLNAILNRKYRELLSRAGQLGLPHGLTSGSATSLPAQLSGEDFISIDIPNGVSEVVGIDVRCSSSDRWQKLDPIAWEQRRDVNCTLAARHGVGFWTVHKAPSVSGSTFTAGKIGVWPGTLTGQYTLHYILTWTDISQDTDVFLIYEGWDEWLLNSAAMACAQRDTNKRSNYDTARDAWLAADALLQSQAARLQRSGSFEPTPYGGLRL